MTAIRNIFLICGIVVFLWSVLSFSLRDDVVSFDLDSTSINEIKLDSDVSEPYIIEIYNFNNRIGVEVMVTLTKNSTDTEQKC